MSGKIVYYIINNEIKRHSGRVGSMSTGKTVAQVGHAAVRIFDTGKVRFLTECHILQTSYRKETFINLGNLFIAIEL